jgi:peroxiredoxin
MKTLVFVLLLMSAMAHGQSVQNFTSTNVVTGKEISLNDFSSSSGIVIIFTSNTCPYDGYYLARMKALAAQYSSKVPILLVNSSLDDNESAEQMKIFADQNALTIPYLSDKDQKVLSMLNPRKSPEAFLLQNIKGVFSLIYRGAIDDNAQSATEVKNSYLNDAITNVLAGQKVETTDVRPVGCSIRKK